MAILIANIGTSDLAVKIDDYYIPVGFDRNEPNIDESELTEDEKIIWDRELRDSLISRELCTELKVKVDENKQGYRSFSFRELTEKLKIVYQNQPQEWHERIRPARISGVIETAITKFNINKIYLIVTNQQQYIQDINTGKSKSNKGYLTDSIYLFDILQIWFKKEYPKIQIIPEIIPLNILPVEQDKLLYHYYQFFLKKEIKNEDIILVSAKGGTGQMQTALKVQALAASNLKQLFIDPKLSIKRILSGQSSECQFTSYWQYIKSQKYDDIKTILERWDFQGAIEILKKWKKLLSFWELNTNDNNLKTNKDLVSRIVDTLEIGSHCYNLDIISARNVWNNNNHLRQNLPPQLIQQVERYKPILNLYTQCKIYDELNQSAYLLSFLASFADEVLAEVARKFYCYNSDYPKKDNRFNKRDFLEDYSNKDIKNKQYYLKILEQLKTLDFWYDQRSQLIHNAKGISKDRLQEVFNNRMQYATNNETKEQYSQACPPHQIVNVMETILKSDLGLIPISYRNRFLGNNAEYYIYSEVKKWTIEKLFNEA